MGKLRAGVYPFVESFIPNLRYGNLIDQYDIKVLINHNGNILRGTEIVKKYSYAKEYALIDWDAYDGTESIDVLIVLKSIETIELKSAISIIEKYCRENVDILMLGVKSEIKDSIHELCSRYNAICKTEVDLIKQNEMIDCTTMGYKLSLQSIDTPIVAIAGVLPVTQKHQIQLGLLSDFNKDGYKVSFIGSEHLCELFGGYSIENVLLGKQLPETHRVYYFNSFLKEIENHDKPDVILIGIEDPILPLSKKHPFNFCIYATELFSAFTPDISIVSLMNGDYNEEFYSTIEQLCQFKYNFTVDACFISRYAPTSTSMYRDSLSYAYTKRTEQPTPKDTVFSDEDIENGNLYNFVKRKLLQFGRCEPF